MTRPVSVWGNRQRFVSELRRATGKDVRVGLVDSGWDRSVPDDRILPGLGFVDAQDDLALGLSSDDNDRIGHGTVCADLILQIAPHVEIVPLRVFGHRLETSIQVLAAALSGAVKCGVHVVNVSLGTSLTLAAEALYSVCEKARRSGLIVVAASSPGAGLLPAVFDNVIGVVPGFFPTPFDYRFRLESPLQCEAKGLGLRARCLGGKAIEVSGASFAAAVIAGVVALCRERHRDATLDEVSELLAAHSLP